MSMLCVCLFSEIIFFPQVITAERDADPGRGSGRWCTQPEGKHFLAHHPFEAGKDKQRPVWS